MKKLFSKRVLSCLLVLIMVAGMIHPSVFSSTVSATPEESTIPQKSETAVNSEPTVEVEIPQYNKLTTRAAPPTSITIDNITLQSGQYLPRGATYVTSTKPEGGYFYYSNGTLTMDAAGYWCRSGNDVISADGDLTIKLIGTNVITIDESFTSSGTGIKTTGKLTFTGSGILEINTILNNGINASGDIDFSQTGTVTVNSTKSMAINCGNNIVVNGNLTSTSDIGYALYANNSITINKGTVNANATHPGYVAIYTRTGAVYVYGGTTNVNADGNGIGTGSSSYLQYGGTVNITAYYVGIKVTNTDSTAAVYGGNLTVTSAQDGIVAPSFKIQAGRATIKSQNVKQDADYYALKLGGNSSGYLQCASHIKATAATEIGGTMSSLSYANLPNYDHVSLVAAIKVNGVEVENGRYLASNGNSTSMSAPSSTTGYAYYKDNVLTLNNYTGSNTGTYGVYSLADLTIQQVQSSVNSLTTGSAYYGIRVRGNLTIQGLGQLKIYGGQRAVYATGTLKVSYSQLLCYGCGIYSAGNMTLSYPMISVSQFGAAAAGTYAIESAGNISVTDGVIDVNCPDYANGQYVRGIVGKNITISGTASLELDTIGMGISGSSNITISGGNVKVNAVKGSGVYASGTLSISGGTVNVTAYNDALRGNKVTVTGGQITAISTDTSADADNCAIKVYSNSSTYFSVASTISVIGNTDTSSTGAAPFAISSLSNYDYVRIGSFVMLHNVELPSGYYMESGNSVTAVSKTAPSSGKYAYYYDGVLTLNNYTYSGTSVAIRTYADTRINLVGGSEVNHIISHAGNLVFTGTVLHIKANLGTAAINTNGDVFIDGGRITVDSGYEGIYCESFYLRGGLAWVTANYHGIDFKSNFTVSSGAITIKSTNTSGDSSYRAINSRVSNPTISITGMNHMVGKTSSPDILESTNFTGSDYDFAAIGEFIMVRGVVLYKGCYLFNGDAQPYQNVGSHTEYAYLKDKNTLELKSYQYSGSAYGIASNIDLTIVLYDEENSIEAKGDYDAIHCNANLTIKGGTNYNDGITVKAADGFGIYAENTFTLVSENVIVSSSDYPVSVGEFIINKGWLKATCTYTGSTYTLAALAAGSATINGGRIDLFAATNRGNALEVDNNLVIKGGFVTINSPKGDGISISDGTMTVQGGDIDITAGGDGIYLYNGSYLSIQGGEIDITATQNGIWLYSGRLNMNGGFLTVASTATSDDSSYRALRVNGTSSNYYNVASSLSQSANSAYTTEIMEKLNPSNLSSYDRILIGDFVIVCGKVVKSGYSADSSGVYSGDKGTGYAYYNNGILTLDQYRHIDSNNRGIQAYSDLTVRVIGDSDSYITLTNNRYAMAIFGNLTLTGSQKLQLASATNPVYVEGNMTLAGSDLTLNANGNAISLEINGNLNVNSGRLETYNGNETGIYVTGNMTMTGGSVYVSGKMNGIHLPNGKLTVTGGFLQAISTNTTNDDTYAALKLAGTTSSYYNVSENLEQRADKSGRVVIGTMISLDPEELSKYDGVVIGQYISVDGTILRSGETMSIGDGSASYVANSEGETLTLNNVTLTSRNGVGIKTSRSLNLILKGDNTLIGNNAGHTIEVGGDLKIDGIGSLNVTNYYIPLYCGGDVEITNATVALNSDNDIALCLINGGTLTVNSGNLTASTRSGSTTYPVAKGVEAVVLGLNRGLFGSASSDGSNLKSVTAADLKDCKYMTIGTCVHKDSTDDFDHDCDLCGVKNVTSHVYKETVYHDTHHWDICNCGAQIGTASEHTFVNGICACGKRAPAPVIEVFENVEVMQGQTIFLNCNATAPGSPALSYQWYQTDSGKIEDITAINGTTANLYVDTSVPGTYYFVCGVNTSHGGSAYSNVIRVIIRPAVFTQQPAGGEVSKDDSYTVNWATNFTPVKLEILEYSDEQPTTLAILPDTATEVILGASKNGYCVRAYYNDTGYIDSDKFYITEKAAQIVQTDSGATYNVRLIEPWALRINVRFKDASGNTIPVSEVRDYGAFAIRGSLLSSTVDVTVEQILTNTDTIHFPMGTEADGGMFPTGDGRATFHFFDGLYTYRLSEEVYWVAYYTDAEGQTYFTKVRNKSLSTLMNSMMSGVSDNEAEVYRWMLDMEKSILEYRNGRTGEAEVANAVTLKDCDIDFRENSGSKYAFGRSYRISLIEPWGIMLNTRIYDTTDANTSSDDHIDYDAVDNYGMIIYHDKSGSLSGMDDYTDLLALDGAYVYSKDQGNLTIDGTKVSVAYNRDIYTYELNSKIYCVTFVIIDGKCYYSAMTTRNLYELMGQRVEQAGTNKNAEIEVYIAMRGMYDSITKYRRGL